MTLYKAGTVDHNVYKWNYDLFRLEGERWYSQWDGDMVMKRCVEVIKGDAVVYSPNAPLRVGDPVHVRGYHRLFMYHRVTSVSGRRFELEGINLTFEAHEHDTLVWVEAATAALTTSSVALPKPTLSTICPCGIHRADCTYHASNVWG